MSGNEMNPIIDRLTDPAFLSAIATVFALIVSGISVFLVFKSRSRPFQTFIYEKQYNTFQSFQKLMQSCSNELYTLRPDNPDNKAIAKRGQEYVTDFIHLLEKSHVIMPEEFNKGLSNIIERLDGNLTPLFISGDFEKFDIGIGEIFMMNADLIKLMRKNFGVPGIISATQSLLNKSK